MHILYALIALTAHVVVIARILTSKRCTGMHGYRVAWTTWMLLAVSGGSAIEVLMRLHAVDFFRAALASVLAVLVWLARGNMDHLIQDDGCKAQDSTNRTHA